MTRVREEPHSPRRARERAGEAPPAPVGIDAVLALQRGAGNAAVTRLLQRYQYETHGETIRYDDNVKGAGPYDASQATNIALKDPAMAALPQSGRTYVSAQTGNVQYLDRTLTESPRVIEVAQRILDEVQQMGGNSSFMLGIVETLDGEIRAASSGASQAGHMTEAVRRLNELHARAVKARKWAEEDRGQKEREAIEQDPGAKIETLGKDYKGLEGEFAHLTPKKHAKEEDQGTLVIKDHVNCAAPQLLAHQLTKVPAKGLHVHLETARLDVKNMTEIYWGKDEYGVMVDGVRYHHRQTVPSCPKCVENLKVVVYKALREAIAAQVEAYDRRDLRSVEDEPGKASGSKGIRERREKRAILDGAHGQWMKLLSDAEDALSHEGTKDLIAQTIPGIRHRCAAGLNNAEAAVWTESWRPNEFRSEFIDGTLARMGEPIEAAVDLLQRARKPVDGGHGRQPQQAIPLAIQKLQQLRSVRR